jgi:DNA-binding NarL/FixJ family response regulator
VKNHVRSIFGKLGVETRVEAVLYAIRQGWVSPDAPGSGEGEA